MMKKTIIIVISIVVAISVLAVNVDLDFDNNQIIDGSDLTTFAFSFGKSVAKGNFVIGDRSNADRSDVNDDGVVDGSDLTVLAFDFGKRVTAQSCSDNTSYGQCSFNKPKYCDNGNLVDSCLRCGCNSGYECVGTSCVLVVAKTCSDGIRNQDETDVDCGGLCTGCGLGKLCLVDSDCLSNNCDGGKCAVTTTQTTNQISQFGITWTFDRPVQYGKFANGDYWVVGPVTIIGIDPKSGDDGTGRIVHGSMINPSSRTGYSQGYDSTMYREYDRGWYTPSLNVARPNNQQLSSSNPLTIQTGSLISSISLPATDERYSVTQLQTAAILTVLSSPAPAGSFRPPYSGSDKTIKFNKNQLDYSILRRLAPVANTPRLKQQAGDAQADSVERMFERPWLDHIPLWSGMGRSHHPKDNMANYGRDISIQVGIGALMLNLDYTNQEKETLLIRFTQLGIDIYGIIQDGGEANFMNGGGQSSGHKFPILLAGLALNDNNMKNIGQKSGDYLYSNGYGPGNDGSNWPPDFIAFGEDDQTFYVAQLDVDATHSAAWNPDYRDAQRIPYTSADIELPEWGIIHANGPERSNKYWNTAYRPVNGCGWAGWVLAVHIMGVKDLWNHDALFDYQDRYMQVTGPGGPWEGFYRQSDSFTEDMWDTYRQNYGCIWALDNPSDTYSQGHYNCAGVIVRCEQISSCSQYPNQRALDYDSCNLGCEAPVVCGDNNCEAGETCSSCPADCSCTRGQICVSGVCQIQLYCDTCEDCDTLFSECSYQECKQDCNPGTGCYYRGGAPFIEDCVDITYACSTLISDCGDYSDEECNSNPCRLSPGCLLDGGNCVQYSANLYYVDVNTGNDLNPGTATLPWKTIQKAADNLMAGDTVLIAPGVYEEGMIVPKNSGTEGKPITYKAFNPNSLPMIVGTVKLDSNEWVRYNPNIYKATISWEPKALYLDDVPLFIAQEPNQQNPSDQMETEYFMKVPYNENDDSTFEGHYQLVDSGFLTQADDFWNGATLLLFDGFTNGIHSREVLDFIASEHKIIMPYNQWALVGDRERDRDVYAIRNHLSILNKAGEYYIDRGELEVQSWNENLDKTLDVTVRVGSAAGNIRRIRFFLINETYGGELTVNTNLQELGTQIFKLDLTNYPKNLIRVYATVDLADAYDLYVWPYNGYNIEDVKISKKESAFDLNNYNSNNNYLIFDGLELKHYQGTALSFSSGYGYEDGTNRNGIVRNCDIHHNMGDGVNCRYDCEGLRVENCKIHNNYGQGISFVGGSNYVVQYNEVYGNLDNGIWAGMGGTEIYYVKDVVIRGNYIHHQGSARTHSDNVQLYKTSNVIVDGNYLLQEGNQNTWFSANGPIYFTNNIVVNGPTGINSANESYIYNNVFYDSRVRLDVGQDDPNYWTKHSEVRNNVFIDTFLAMPPEHLRGNVIVDHNFYSVSSGFYKTLWEQIGFGEGSIINPDPLHNISLYNYFDDLTDFTLKAGSALIDAGYSPVPMDIDYNGNNRIQGLGPDIGAHETAG